MDLATQIIEDDIDLLQRTRRIIKKASTKLITTHRDLWGPSKIFYSLSQPDHPKSREVVPAACEALRAATRDF